jgi:hypothetical protein
MFSLKTVPREGWVEIEDRMHVRTLYGILQKLSIINVPSAITLYKLYQCVQFHNISEALYGISVLVYRLRFVSSACSSAIEKLRAGGDQRRCRHLNISVRKPGSRQGICLSSLLM